MQDVRLMGLYEVRSLAGFLALSSGMMTASSHDPGHLALLKEWLKILRSSVFPLSPSSFKKEGGISSGPAAPFLFMAWMACSSSCIVKLLQSIDFGPEARRLRSFFSRLLRSLSLRVNLCRLTLA